MVQGYYKLEEAAQVLALSPDALKRMAQKNEIRSFQDRGTWRFRIQDVQELARQRGLSSDPEAPVAAPAGGPRSSGPRSSGPRSSGPKSSGPKSSGPKSSGPKSSGPKSKGPRTPQLGNKGREVFDFEIAAGDEDLGIGLEGFVQPPSTAGRKSTLGGGRKSALSPQPGSDSDVRLVGSGSEDFGADLMDQPLTPKPGSDSDVRLVGEGSDDFGEDLINQLPPTPRPGSDSGARLVGQGSNGAIAFDTSPVLPDSDVRLEGLPGPSTPKVAGQKSSLRQSPASSVGKRLSKIAPNRSDSGVRLVPMDSDSDVRLIAAESAAEIPIGELPLGGPSDSDVRLENYDINPSRSDEGMLTEEINLDEEIRRQEERLKGARPKSRVRKKSEMTSPFELNESHMEESSSTSDGSSDFDIDLGATVALGEDFGLELPAGMTQLKAAPDDGGTEHLGSPFKSNAASPGPKTSMGPKSSAGPKSKKSKIDSSSDFELSIDDSDSGTSSDSMLLAPASDSEFELALDSDAEFETGLPSDSDSVDLKPTDSEFELSIDSDSEFEVSAGSDSDSAELSPADSEFELTVDSDSEFDLSVDSESDSGASASEESSEDFELSVDDDSNESSSESSGEESDFELSLDDSSEEAPAAAGDQDIFETDFDVPELDEEGASGSDVQALDTDSDSAFEFDEESDDLSVDDASGSQVMALDEEEAEDGAVTIAGDVDGEDLSVDEDGEAAEFSELDEAPDLEAAEGDEEAVPSRTVKQVQVQAAPWGMVPVLFMFPCVIIMMLVGLMGFELVQTMKDGYRPAGFLTKTFSQMLGKPLP